MTSVRHTLINTMFRCGCLLSSIVLRIPVKSSNQPHAELINCSYLRLEVRGKKYDCSKKDTISTWQKTQSFKMRMHISDLQNQIMTGQ